MPKNLAMPNLSVAGEAIRIKAFEEKLRQTLKLIDAPLVILNLNARNPNYVMYTLVEDHASPAALIINPDGQTRLIVNSIENDMLAHLEKLVSLQLYGGMNDFYKCLSAALPQGGKIYVEISEQIFDLDSLPRRLYERLKEQNQLVSAQDILVNLRSCKTPPEIKFITAAIDQTLEIFNTLTPMITAGTTEETLAQTIMTAIIGADAGISFKPIVASGPRIVSPHPLRHTKRQLSSGDWLIIDFGLSINGYTSDLTRTYLVDADYQTHKFYTTYQEMLAFLLAQDLARTTPVALAGNLRQIAVKNDLGDYEKHSYGHGLGVAVHDIYPSISTYKGCLGEIPFADNVVFTFEPGFYATDKPIGFRIENDFLIQNGQAVRLGLSGK